MRTRFNRAISLTIAALLLITTLGSDALTAKAVEVDADATYSEAETTEAVEVSLEDYVVTDAVDDVVLDDETVTDDGTITEGSDETEVIGEEDELENNELEEGELEEDELEEDELEDDEEEEEDEYTYDEPLDSYKTVGGVKVSAKAEAGVFPDGTIMSVSLVENEAEEKVADAVDDATENDVTSDDIFAVDITFTIDGEEIQPNGNVDVTFENVNLEGDELQVFHIDDESGEAEVVSDTVENNGTVEVEADQFSIYVIVTVNNEQTGLFYELHANEYTQCKLNHKHNNEFKINGLWYDYPESRNFYVNLARKNKPTPINDCVTMPGYDIKTVKPYYKDGNSYKEITHIYIDSTTGEDLLTMQYGPSNNLGAFYYTSNTQSNVYWLSSYPISRDVCSVIFNAGYGKVEGSTKKQFSYNKGDAVGLIADKLKAIRKGYILDGWYIKNGEACNKITSETIVSEKETEYHAHWKRAWNIIFDANGGTGTMDDIVIIKDEDIEAGQLECTYTAPEGKVFDYWSAGNTKINSENIMNVLNSDYSNKASVTLTANWKNNPVTKYDVTFDAPGATATSGSLDAVKVNANGTITLPTVKLDDYNNYNFLGWYVDGEGSAYAAGDEYTVLGNVNFVAKWTTNVNVYIATGNSWWPGKAEHLSVNAVVDTKLSGDSQTHDFPSDATVSFSDNDKATLKNNGYDVSNITWVDYKLWNDFADINGSDTQTHFHLNGKVNTVSVTYDTDGATSATPTQAAVVPGTAIKLAEAPIKAGYTFNGWYVDDTYVGGAGDSYTVNGAVTIKAQWLQNGSATINLADNLTYTGAAQTLATVLNATGDVSFRLKKGETWIDGANATAAGRYEVYYSVAAADGYTAVTETKAGEVTISAKEMTDNNLTVEGVVAKDYTGNAIEQSVTLKDGEKTLVEGVDYTVAYSNNVNASEKAEIKFTFKDNYKGEVTKNFTINKLDATITAISVTKKYKEQEPALTATVDGAIEGEELAYTVKRESGEKVGDYKLDVKLISGAEVNKNYNITIVDSDDDATIKFTITRADGVLNVTLNTLANGDSIVDKVLNLIYGNGSAIYDVEASEGENAYLVTWGKDAWDKDVVTAELKFNNSKLVLTPGTKEGTTKVALMTTDKNHTKQYWSVDVTVKNGKIEYTIPQKQTAEYNAKNQTIADIVVSDVTVEGQADKATPVVTYSTEENGTYSSTKPEFKNVGTYTVFYKVNYQGYAEEAGSVDFEITKSDDAILKNLTITPWTFGVYDAEKNAPSAEFVSLLTDETGIDDVAITYTYFDKNGNAVEDIATALPGAYKVVATATADNYVDTTAELEFTISKATVNYYITGAGINNWSGSIATGELNDSYYNDYASLATYAKDVRGVSGDTADDYARRYTSNVRRIIKNLKDAGYKVEIAKFSTVRDTIHVDFVVTDKPVVTMDNFTYGETATPTYSWTANDSYSGFTPATEGTNYTVAYKYYGTTKSHIKIGSKENPVDTAPTQAGDYKVKVVIDADNNLYDCESSYVSYSINQAVAEFNYVITNSKLAEEAVALDRKNVDGVETVTYNKHHYTVAALLANPVVAGDQGIYASLNDNYQNEVGSYTSAIERIKNSDGTKNYNYTLAGSNSAELKWAIAYLEADDVVATSKVDINETDGWFNGAVTLTKDGYNIKAEDAGSFHTKLVYNEDGKYSVNYQLRLGSDGGYITDTKTVEFNIDKTAPTVDAITAGDYSLLQQAVASARRVFFKNSTTVFVTASDKMSGMDKLEYQIVEDGNALSDEWTAYPITGIAVDNSLKATIYVRAIDEASLVSRVNTDGVVVYKDAHAVTTDIEYTRSKNEEEQLNKDVVVALNDTSVKAVRNGETLLTSDQYSVNGNTITIFGSYLNTLNASEDGTEYTFYVDYNPYGLTFMDGVDEGADATSTSFMAKVKKHTDEITNVSDISKVYDGTAVEAPSFDSASTGKVSMLYTGTTKAGVEYSSNECPVDAGEYQVTISVEADDNYVASTKTIDFAISQRVAEFGWAISNTENVLWYPVNGYLSFWADGQSHNPTAQLSNAADGQVRYISHPAWAQTFGGWYVASINPDDEEVYHVVGIDENGESYRDYNYTLVGTQSQLSLAWAILVRSVEREEAGVASVTEPVEATTVIANPTVPAAGDTGANAGGRRAAAVADDDNLLEQIDDEVTPLAAEDDATVIDDEETPEGIEDILCNLHWWIILLVGAYAIYSIGTGVYRKKLINEISKDER